MQYLPQFTVGLKYTILKSPQFIAVTLQLSLQGSSIPTIQAPIFDCWPYTVGYEPTNK